MSTSGGTSGGGYPAIPVAIAGSTVVTITDPFTGGPDQLTVLQLPNAAPPVVAFAVQQPGDLAPSVVFIAGDTPSMNLLDPTATFPDRIGGMSFESNTLSFTSTGDINFFPGSGVVGIDSLQTNHLDVTIDCEAECDFTWTGSGVGPVLVDTTNGHTYRLRSTNGALVLQQVT